MNDVHLAIRRLGREPRVTFAAVFALALGIGLATTMFSVLRGVLLRGLPVEDAGRLMMVGQEERAFEHGGMGTSAADFATWQEGQQSFEALGAYQALYTFVTGEDGGTENWVGAYGTPETFEILRVRPHLGRLFTDEDTVPGAPKVVLLGHQAWQRQFGGAPDLLGKTVKVNRQDATVVGVMPEGFGFPYRQQIWMPMKVSPRAENMMVFALGRLGPGVSREAARDELQALSNHFRADGPWVDDLTDRTPVVLVKPYLQAITDPTAQRTLLVLFVVACAVLLVACANVANLLLARGLDRFQESTVRSALGASRLRLLTPLLAEAFLLASSGGVLGLSLSFWGVWFFRSTLESSYLMAFWVDVRVDLQTAAFVALTVLIVSLLAGVAPAFRATQMGGTVRGGTVRGGMVRGEGGLRIGILGRALVVAQVTVSVALLVGVGIMTRTLLELASTAAAVDAGPVLTARLSPWQGEYPDDASLERFFRRVEERLNNLPEVEALTITSTLPLGRVGSGAFTIEGAAEGEPVQVRRVLASAGYFETFGVEVLRGRAFRTSDNASGDPVAIVNQSFAERHLPFKESLGARLRQGDGAWIQIVGVVPEITAGPFDRADAAAVYLPIAQHPQSFARLAVRTRGEPLALVPRLRQEITAIDRFATLYEVETMETSLSRETWSHRMAGFLVMLMGASTLLLAAVGLYSVLTFSVRRRIRELGVRRALGARGGDLMRLVLGSGLWQVALGLLLGLLAAAALGRVLQSLLEGVAGWDATSFFGATLVLLAVSLFAGLGPARWASRVDPMVVLRQD